MSPPAAKIRRCVEGILPACALSRCSRLQAAPQAPSGALRTPKTGAVSHQSGGQHRGAAGAQAGSPGAPIPLTPSSPSPAHRESTAQPGGCCRVSLSLPPSVGAAAGSPPCLPLAQAQDDGLPVLRSVVGNACGERQRPGWRCGQEDRATTPQPPQALTHPSAGWCRGRPAAASSAAPAAALPGPAPRSGRGPGGCPGSQTWGVEGSEGPRGLKGAKRCSRRGQGGSPLPVSGSPLGTWGLRT